MISSIKKLFDYTLGSTMLYKHCVHKLCYPGLHIAPSASIENKGDFSYKNNGNINECAKVIIPNATQLELGEQCYIGRYVEISPQSKIQVGDYTSIQDRCIILGDVQIGRYCLLSLNVLMTTGKHQFEKEPYLLIRDQDAMLGKSTNTQSVNNNKIRIEDDCWIGVNTVIMPGVVIGKGSVIGANSVVTKSIPPYSVAVGTPARVIKKRLDFLPPESIHFEKKQDHPYFYGGIEISAPERAQSRRLEGVLTKNNFELALNVTGNVKVKLEVKSIGGEQELTFKNKTHTITNQFTQVVYDLEHNQDKILNFHVKPVRKNTRLIIKRAWVE